VNPSLIEIIFFKQFSKNGKENRKKIFSRVGVRNKILTLPLTLP